MQKKLYLLITLLVGVSLPVFAMDKNNNDGDEKKETKPRIGASDLINAVKNDPEVLRSLGELLSSEKRNPFYGAYSFGGKYGDKDGSGILNEHFMKLMFGPDGTVMQYLQPKNGGKPEYFNAMGEIIKYSGLRGVTSGVMNATDAVVKEASKDILSATVGRVKNAFSWVYNTIAHGNARLVSVADIYRWSGATKNIFKNLISAAEDAAKGPRIGADMGRYHIPGFGEDKTDNVDTAVKPKEPETDPLWKEASILYLMAIENIVKEIELRRSYHKKSDEMVRCFDSLLLALVGEIKIEKRLVEKKVKDRYGVIELKLVETDFHTFHGGIYRCINEANRLSDLSSVEKVAFMKSIYHHIKGLLQELGTWVKMKQSKKENKESSSLGFEH